MAGEVMAYSAIRCLLCFALFRPKRYRGLALCPQCGKLQPREFWKRFRSLESSKRRELSEVFNGLMR